MTSIAKWRPAPAEADGVAELELGDGGGARWQVDRREAHPASQIERVGPSAPWTTSEPAGRARRASRPA